MVGSHQVDGFTFAVPLVIALEATKLVDSLSCCLSVLDINLVANGSDGTQRYDDDAEYLREESEKGDSNTSWADRTLAAESTLGYCNAGILQQ